jgi:hypothetical protein
VVYWLLMRYLMGYNGIYNKDVMGKSIPSGKLTDSELENHHF